MERIDKRLADQLRQVKITEDFVSNPEASFLMEMGNTKIICNATIETKLPHWLKDSGKGWVTAEYSLLPRSTDTRVKRERNSVSGRTQEIQRLIGRSLRGVCDLKNLCDKNIILDCDVIQADGGTRTASVVGAFLALAKALQKLKADNPNMGQILKHWLAAISVGMVGGAPLLDLCYTEDLAADVDMNVIMTDKGDFVEIQGTGEESVFSRSDLDSLLGLAHKGCMELIEIQKSIIGPVLP